MKNFKTQEITFGAMIAAIFGMLLLLNRQTGGMLEEVFLFAFPIPMVAYSAKYGWKKSLPVFAVTVLIAILCGTFSGFFYAASESFIGMVYGAMLNQKKDPGKTLFLVMVLSALANILSSVVLASLFGINLQTEMKEMQKMMIDTMEKVYGSQGMMAGAAAGTDTASMVEAMKSIFNVNYLLRIYIISMILLGVIQGLIIYQLSLIILRRLKFQVQKPQPLLQFYPPVWTGAVALTAFLCYFISMMYPPAECQCGESCADTGNLRLSVPDLFWNHRRSGIPQTAAWHDEALCGSAAGSVHFRAAVCAGIYRIFLCEPESP